MVQAPVANVIELFSLPNMLVAHKCFKCLEQTCYYKIRKFVIDNAKPTSILHYVVDHTEISVTDSDKLIGLDHPLDGVTNPKYKLLHFLTTK
jgi:hypothetical protein